MPEAALFSSSPPLVSGAWPPCFNPPPPNIASTANSPVPRGHSAPCPGISPNSARLGLSGSQSRLPAVFIGEGSIPYPTREAIVAERRGGPQLGSKSMQCSRRRENHGDCMFFSVAYGQALIMSCGIKRTMNPPSSCWQEVSSDHHHLFGIVSVFEPCSDLVHNF